MRWAAWRTWRWLVGAAVLGVVALQTGSGPFVAGLSSLDAVTLVLGGLVAVLTTVACAWRWHLVARGLGARVPLGRAVASCYRAQFLNLTLPGGIIGDVHRGVRHGRDTGDTGRGLRAVAWERTAGQVVQAVIVCAILLVLPSPVRSWAPAMLVVLVSALVFGGVVLLGVRRGRPEASRSALARLGAAAREDVRRGLLSRRAWPGVVTASALCVLGHLATYLLAARAVGVPASTTALVPLALVVLLAAGVPANLAGWGPREGMAAWVFGAAGLGAGQGVAVAVAFGAIVLVANLPGAVVLLVAAARRSPARPSPSRRSPARVADRANALGVRVEEGVSRA
jgi:uncharacterized membrane protein YbhN (UPF0104 family)